MACITCNNLIKVWGTFVCDIDKTIIHNPELYGRFCVSRKEAQDEKAEQNISKKERKNQQTS